MMKFAAWPLVALLMFVTPAHAQRKISFQSKFDRFELTITGGRGEVAGKTADLASVRDLLPLIGKSLPDSCPSLKKAADLTIREGDKTRSVYVDAGIVSDHKNCITIGGDGIFYFPVHRDFLTGPKRAGFKIKSPFKVFQQGQKIIELRKDGDRWVSENASALLDWEFVDRLHRSLEDFSIRLRVQEGIGKDKTKMIIQNGGETLEFYKVTGIMWALKQPGQGWLTASDEWSFWRDFEPSLYEDRFAPEIRQYLEASDKDAKMAALGKVEGVWSQNLRELYHKIALQENEDPALRGLAIRRLRSKPATETAGVMLKILEESTNDDLRDDAAVVLRLNHPKGPRWKASDPPEEKQRALEFWRTWWRQKKSGP